VNVRSLNKAFNNWQWRNLTLFGRIQTIKTIAKPKRMFRASVLNLDKGFMKKTKLSDV